MTHLACTVFDKMAKTFPSLKIVVIPKVLNFEKNDFHILCLKMLFV